MNEKLQFEEIKISLQLGPGGDGDETSEDSSGNDGSGQNGEGS
jgi:hypothetical protein